MTITDSLTADFLAPLNFVSYECNYDGILFQFIEFLVILLTRKSTENDAAARERRGCIGAIDGTTHLGLALQNVHTCGVNRTQQLYG